MAPLLLGYLESMVQGIPFLILLVLVVGGVVLRSRQMGFHTRRPKQTTAKAPAKRRPLRRARRP
jgi:hypothetical protein